MASLAPKVSAARGLKFDIQSMVLLMSSSYFLKAQAQWAVWTDMSRHSDVEFFQTHKPALTWEPSSLT
ncbi:hypothetical protein HJFPF1_05203 [Paramyrothecium foliicola]|nr:hypothetical protein HJFPF1_05203 [Paramyrothecium foliicola]